MPLGAACFGSMNAAVIRNTLTHTLTLTLSVL